MRSTAPRTQPWSGAPARRFVPALPTLEPRLLMPSWSPPRAPLFPFEPQRDGSAPSIQHFYLARAGVFHAIRHFLGGRPGTVLLPAYHHGVEVEAVRAAGAKLAFYRIDSEMRVDLDDLAERARAPEVRVVYLTHFAGFAQPVAEVARLCRERGLFLVEDCALALLSRDPFGRPLGQTGDAAVFCLYKTLPVPHGGLLVARDVPLEDSPAPPLASTLHHAAGLLLADLELHSSGLGRTVRALARAAAHATVDALVPMVQTGTQHLRARDLELGASRLVEQLVGRIDLELVRVKRRRNFRRLADALAGAPLVGAPLAEGACPLFVPLRVRDKPSALAALRARGVEAIDFWRSGDPACDLKPFPEVAALRREVIELPCHQSLDDDAIDFVARAVKSAKEVLAHA